MIKVTIKTNTARIERMVEVDKTPAELFEQEGIHISNSSISLDGTILDRGNMNETFAELNVSDGDSIVLGSITKLDGANE